MKKNYFLTLALLGSALGLRAQDMSVELAANSPAVVQGGTDFITLRLCNNSSSIPLAANRIRPRVSFPSEITTPTTVTNADGSPLTGFSEETRLSTNVVRLINTSPIAGGTCVNLRLYYEGTQAGSQSATANTAWQGAPPIENDATNDNATLTLNVTASTPVSLAAFTLRAQGHNAELSWSTAQERNNAFFEVQHSTNGRSFETVGQVAGKGTTAQRQQYHFTHAELNPALTHYYRLKQVDFNGQSELSVVRSLQLEGYQGISLWAATQSDRTVKAVVNYGDEELAKAARVSLLDLSGRTLSTQQLELVKGLNAVEFQTSSLGSGLYLIRLENPSKNQAVKVALP
ncbi:T9SS type A sorting domain-containing protein [Siphonobacter sp. SORGH_AS_0500]|uniref:T9SS type A sorting domain-containing protein n=2 Tax=Siphonobacter sp. SORGH_AS_0500 TaxID=1864824 RepID=UPI002865D325|nr:T9SS type A sorting domain-containing protein [Siphonobacter sp. SORGH_AS_0500]MDR6195679.1 hypothetical protein [Siphonobacter sp. SORGH_AS_0500]